MLSTKPWRGRWVNFLNGGDRYAHAGVLALVAPHLGGEALVVTARARDASTGIRIPRDWSFAARDLELVAHQATFFAKSLFERVGDYSIGYRIRMDFEWMLRLPATTPSIWLDEDLVSFEGGGISTTRPLRSCVEELRALSQHRRGAARIVKLVTLYLPWRVLRHAWRRLAGASMQGAPGT